VYDYLCSEGGGVFRLERDWPFSFPPGPDCIAFGGTPGLVFDLRNGVFISKVLRAGVSWGVRKVTYSLNFSDSKRFYSLLDAEDQTSALSATAVYRMMPHTSFHSSLTLTRVQVPVPLAVTAREDDLMTLSFGLNHQFAEDLSGTLTLRHTQRESNAANSDYDENRLTATVNMRF
jgi:uncharacterized protein (PEP-CTERM system associated)